MAGTDIALGVNSSGRPICLVSNEHTGVGSRSLQAGIDAATAGDTLVVKGLCVGSSSIDKNLTLKGVSNKPFGIATLVGDAGGTVLAISAGIGQPSPTVAVENLVISHGINGAGGIHNAGTLALTDSAVRGNSGPGIVNQNLEGRPILTLTNSTVTDNGGGGIVNVLFGSVTGSHVTVSGNSGGDGAGIFNQIGTVSLSNSIVSDNAASAAGGGVFNNGTLMLTSSTVRGNSAAYGGGIFNFGSATLADSTVGGNSATYGAGIYNLFGALTLADSTVSRNNATSAGGGTYADGEGTFSLTGATDISENSPDNCYPPGSVPGCSN